MAEENFKCRLLSWEEAWSLSKATAKKVIDCGYEPDLIIGLTRGGWIPAVNLSDLLGVKDLRALRVEHWGVTATKNGKARLRNPLTTDLTDRNILVVDDLTDTGESMLVSVEHLKTLNPREIKTATLLHKTRSTFKPDFYGKEVRKWIWIILPWNLTEDLRNLMGRVMGDKKERSLDEIRDSLKEKFSLDVGKETLKEVLEGLKKKKSPASVLT